MRCRVKIVLIYALFIAVGWLLFESGIADTITHELKREGWLNIEKGMAFIALSSLLLSAVLSRDRHLQLGNGVPPRAHLGRLFWVLINLSVLASLLAYSIYRAYLPEVPHKTLTNPATVAVLKVEPIESWLIERDDNASARSKDPYLVKAAAQWVRDPQDNALRDSHRIEVESMRPAYDDEADLRRWPFWLSLAAFGAMAAVIGAGWLFWHAQQQTRQMAMRGQAPEQDELLRLFFDLPFLGMAISSPKTMRWRHVNARLCAMLGYTREELLQLTWAEVTHPDDLGKNIAEFERALRGEIDGYQMDKRYVRKDGGVVETTLVVKVNRDPQGEVKWLLATVQDITERKQMENELRASEAKLRAIIDAEPECVKIIGADGTLQFMNPAGLEMLGAESLAQVQGRLLEDIITPDYRESFRRFTHKILHGGRAALEFEIVGLTGQKRIMETHAVPLRLEHEGPVFLLGITRDITERKRMEKQLHLQLNELLRWQQIMLGREDRVQELKREVNALLASRNEAIRYPSQETT